MDAAESRRLTRLLFGAIAVITTFGLSSSAILLTEYMRPVPLFCSESGGCGALHRSAFSHVLGIPLPAIGVFGWVVLAVLIFFRGERARLAHLFVSGVAGAIGLLLILLQARLGAFCIYCLTTDSSAIVLVALSGLRTRREIDRPGGKLPVVGVAAAFLVAAIAPEITSRIAGNTMPPVVAAELAKTPAGKVTIVDFVDFECPFCRQTHEDLSPIVAEHRDRVRLVRKQVPLAHIHPHANTAALAGCCADDLGKGDDMAAKLFEAPLEELTPEGCERMATSVGLDPARFKACVADPATQAKVNADHDAFRASGGRGLPTLWIGTHRIDGAQGPDVLRSTLEAALEGR